MIMRQKTAENTARHATIMPLTIVTSSGKIRMSRVILAKRSKRTKRMSSVPLCWALPPTGLIPTISKQTKNTHCPYCLSWRTSLHEHMDSLEPQCSGNYGRPIMKNLNDSTMILKGCRCDRSDVERPYNDFEVLSMHLKLFE